MADFLPRGLILPPIPPETMSALPGEKPEPIRGLFMRQVFDALTANNVEISDRIEAQINTGLAAEIPDSTGDGTLWYSTDTMQLSIDLQDTGWVVISDYDAFLPLTAGSGYPLTGDLHIHGTSPSLTLKENGDAGSLTLIEDNASLAYFRKSEPTGSATIHIAAEPTDTTSASLVGIGFTTNSSSASKQFAIYDGTAAQQIQHTFNLGTGMVDLCQLDGQLTVYGDGIIEAQSLSGPSYFRLNAEDVAAYQAQFYQYLNKAYLTIENTGGDAYLQLDPKPDATGWAWVSLFRDTNTSGDVDFRIYKGDGTNATSHIFEGNTGDAYFNTGNLYLDATSAPSIFLREAGASGDYSLLQDNSASLLRFRKVSSAAQSIMDLEPFPSDGTSDARIRIFRSTNTTGSCDLEIYQGDGTATQAHRFEGDTGDAYLCQQGGNVTIEEGNVYLDKTSQPTISLREGGSATDYTYLIDSASLGAFVKRAATGAATLRCDPLAIDGTSGATMQFFRTTNTTGSVDLIIYPGDGSATNTFRFEADTGNAFINSGSLYLDKTTSPTIYLREAGSTTSYGFLQNSSASTSILAHAANSGLAYLQLEARASDGTSGAFIQMNRNTNTTGVSSGVYIYKADGSSTVNYQFLSKGDCQLNKDSGNAYFYGNVYLDKTSNPSIYLRESADTTSYFLLQDQDDNTALINKYTNSGTCYLNLNPMSSGTDSSYIRMFRNVNTTGASGVSIYKADGSSTLNHQFLCKSDAHLCLNAGDVGIGTNSPTEKLDVNSDAIRIRSSQTPASAGAAGAAGTICWDSSYVYVCIAANTWRRVSLFAW